MAFCASIHALYLASKLAPHWSISFRIWLPFTISMARSQARVMALALAPVHS